jgi:peptidoglycan hydrolase-like protein with peptidoglycan-binding domain
MSDQTPSPIPAASTAPDTSGTPASTPASAPAPTSTQETPPSSTPPVSSAPAATTGAASPDARDEKIRELEAQLAAAGSKPAAATPPAVDLSDGSQEERAEHFADWPKEGGMDTPQPWDHSALGLGRESQDLSLAGQGQANTVAPVVVDHGRPILTSGSADQAVHELGRILGVLGFDNSVARGENPYGAVDPSVMAAVHAFRAAFDVLEDPTAFGGNTPAGRALAAEHIGPWTWEAILRAGEQSAAKA